MQDAMRRFNAEIFEVLAQPTRIAILELLCEREAGLCALSATLGMEQAYISEHLSVLRMNQLVVSRREGKETFYAVANPILIDVLNLMRGYSYARMRQRLQQALTEPIAAQRTAG